MMEQVALIHEDAVRLMLEPPRGSTDRDEITNSNPADSKIFIAINQDVSRTISPFRLVAQSC